MCTLHGSDKLLVYSPVTWSHIQRQLLLSILKLLDFDINLQAKKFQTTDNKVEMMFKALEESGSDEEKKLQVSINSVMLLQYPLENDLNSSGKQKKAWGNWWQPPSFPPLSCMKGDFFLCTP